ncbi:MAG: thioredoxin family protein [Bacteroidota bacterium]
MNNIHSYAHFQEVIGTEPAVLIYFSHDQCSVCKVLKPKVADLLAEQFPKMEMFYCNTLEQSEVAAQNRIFSVPTVLVFFDGRETFRYSRNISLDELKTAIQRPYNLMF